MDDLEGVFSHTCTKFPLNLEFLNLEFSKIYNFTQYKAINQKKCAEYISP